MAEPQYQVCRGCVKELSAGEGVSLETPGVRELYEKCTYLTLPDPSNDPHTKEICSECYKQCQAWLLFKTICNDNEHQLTGNGSEEDVVPEPAEVECKPPDVVPAPELKPSDGSFEEMRLELDEEDEEDDEVSEETIPMASPKKESGQEKDVADFDFSNCPVCGVVFFDQPELKDHLKDHVTKEDPKCPLCTDKFSSATQAISHILAKHVEHEDAAPEEEQMEQKSHATEDVEEKMETNESEDPNEIIGDKDLSICDTLVSTWSCPFCDSKFQQKAVFHQHLKDDHNCEVDQACRLCPTIPFKNVEHLLKHIVSQHMAKYMESKDCPKTFPTPRLSNGHVKHQVDVKDQKDKHWPCPVCQEPFSDNHGFGIHLKKKHLKKNDKNCPVCLSSFDTTAGLIKHITQVHIKKWKCPVCLKRFYSPSSYAKHTEGHQKEKTTPWNCKMPECDQEFPDYAALRKHLVGKHLTKDKTCPECHLQLQTTEEFIAHVIRTHVPGKWDCTHCKLGFDFEDQFVYHVKNSHFYSGDNEISVKGDLTCPWCPEEKFKDYSGFKSHIFGQHAQGQVLIDCHLCMDQLDDGKELLNHLFGKHLKCILACNNCDHEGNLSTQIEEHLDTDHNIGKTSCTVCGKQVREMELHMKVHNHPIETDKICLSSDLKTRIHNLTKKVKSHKCTTCKKKFKQASGLSRHKLMHKEAQEEMKKRKNNNSPFGCTQCDKKYMSTKALKVHVKIHHKET